MCNCFGQYHCEGSNACQDSSLHMSDVVKEVRRSFAATSATSSVGVIEVIDHALHALLAFTSLEMQ